MKRITVEMVKEAYAKTGNEPLSGLFFSPGCACAIGAMYELKTGSRNNRLAGLWAGNEFGNSYLGGFVDGFDANSPKGLVGKYPSGYKDGRAAWEAVKP